MLLFRKKHVNKRRGDPVFYFQFWDEKFGGTVAASINKMIFKPPFKLTAYANLLGAILFLATALSTAQAAQSVTLAWSPSSDSSVVGYRVHYGTSSGHYTTTIDVGNLTTATISNLTAGGTFYFVVTAYNASGVDSAPTNETSAVSTGSPTVVLATPGNSVNFNGPTALTLSATASEVGGSIAKVEFYEGSTKVGEATGAPFTAVWGAKPGSHTLTAVAYDATGASVQSTAMSVTVTQPAISSMQRQTDGTYQLTLKGAPGRSNSVYVSSDLQNWTLLTTVVNATGTIAVLDAQAVNATRRYYRLAAN